MNKLAIIYHSAHGHTEHIARQICKGAEQIDGTEVHLLRAEDVTSMPDDLVEFDGFILGSPTYLGGVSGPFKTFMDATGRLWRSQQLQGRLAAGFTVSSLPAGDKQSTLLSMFVFCMQHGMLWAGLPLMPTGRGSQDLNRMSGFLGLMTQSDNAPVEVTPPQGDLDTAIWFGEYLALLANRFK